MNINQNDKKEHPPVFTQHCIHIITQRTLALGHLLHNNMLETHLKVQLSYK